SEPSLENGQGKANRSDFTLILEGFCPVELISDVLGDFLVKHQLGVRQFVGYGVRTPLGEQRRAVELEKLFLHHPTHEVGHIYRMNTITKAALKPVAIQ